MRRRREYPKDVVVKGIHLLCWILKKKYRTSIIGPRDLQRRRRAGAAANEAQ